MCGICGFYGRKDKRLLKEMTDILSHRGPDGEGFYEDERVSLGHRRLSIIDLSLKAAQPMTNEYRDVWAAVNGEIYNYKELRKELISLAHVFYSQSDSEVVVHAYEQWGEDFVNKLNGMFAIALWDFKDKKLVLARDRFGIKPLYYTQCGAELFFASEIKAILKCSRIKKEVNTEGFFEYIAFQCILGTETMFKGIHKLPPGHLLIYKDNNLTKRRYWYLEDEQAKLSAQGFNAQEALTNAVNSHLVSDVPIGVLLSGGLDSSAIVAIMHKLKLDNIQTFTVGFNQPDDEFTFARQIADQFNTKHHEFIIEPGHLEGMLEKIAWHMDEPIADAGAIATYLAGQKVKDFVKVLLVGEGGDEALAGYNWHKLAVFPLSVLPVWFRKKMYFYLTTFYRYKSKIPREQFLRLFRVKSDFLEAMAKFEISYILPNSLLMKVDKMSMANSIEARVPFLDYSFVLGALSIRTQEKVSFFKTKIVLRKCMKGILPDNILRRKKHGFILPVDKWLNNQLRDFTYYLTMASDTYTSRIFQRNYIKGLFEKKIGLQAIENNSLLWRILIFELWHKAYFKDADVIARTASP